MPLLIPYALDRDGEFVEPLTAHGLGPFTCADCEQDIVLRAGEILRPHFAHKSGDGAPDCGMRTRCKNYGCRAWTKPGLGGRVSCIKCEVKCDGCGFWVKKARNVWVAICIPCGHCGTRQPMAREALERGAQLRQEAAERG